MIHFEMFARLLLVIGSLLMLTKYVGINVLSGTIEKYMYLIIGLAGLHVMFDRDYYLPFLGKCAIPQPSSMNHSKTKLIITYTKPK